MPRVFHACALKTVVAFATVIRSPRYVYEVLRSACMYVCLSVRSYISKTTCIYILFRLLVFKLNMMMMMMPKCSVKVTYMAVTRSYSDITVQHVTHCRLCE